MEQIKKSSVFEGVTPYHWMVVLIASGGWLFDCMDQRIFALAREPALTELLHGNDEGLAKLKSFGGMATGAMILGTVIDELERRDGRYGVAAICGGAGIASAIVIERWAEDRA